MRFVLAALLLAVPFGAHAQSFDARADAGDVAIATRSGQEFLEQATPDLVRAVFGCIRGQERLEPGTVLSIVADVAQDGTPSNLAVRPANGSASCVERRLDAFKLPAPRGWDWSRGSFPVTFRIGVAGDMSGSSQGAAQ